MELKQAVTEVYYWQYSNTNSFYNCFISLYMKADKNNRHNLTKAFPNLCLAINLWQAAGNNGDELFEKYGIMQPQDDKQLSLNIEGQHE